MRVDRTTRRGRGRARDDGSSRAAERAAEMRSRRRGVVTALSLMLLSAAVGLVLGIFGSELFAVRSVLVESQDQSLAAEAAQHMESLSFGTIWLPPMREIEGRIGGLPRAKAVRVERALPSTLTIVVEPRAPVAAVHQDGRFMVVDEDGMCMHWTGSVARGLPLVRIEQPARLNVGARLSARDVELMNAVRAGLAETQLLEGARIDLSRPVRVEVLTADGVLGKLGSEELLYEKALMFGKLLHSLREKGEAPLYVDLRVPSRPTFKRLD